MKSFFQRNFILLPFFLLFFFVLFFHFPVLKDNFYNWIDWKTILVLSALLLVTTGLKESNYFYRWARIILLKVKRERDLVLLLLILTVIFSMFLTNDIALLIVVPLTLAFQEYLKTDLVVLIVLEAIAANVGSLLTPIGNPQNLFLYHQWGISFIKFIWEMFPLFLLSLLVLLAFVFFVFSHQKLSLVRKRKKQELIPKLFYLSIANFFLLIFTLDFSFFYWSVGIVFFSYILFYPQLLKKADWFLIILFMIMFLDFRYLASLEGIKEIMRKFSLERRRVVFFLSLLTSQIFSNVPASIFMSQFSHDYKVISYGVNLAGNGFIIGSLANIIAIRFWRGGKIWLLFHLYSLPYFFLTSLLAFFLLNL